MNKFAKIALLSIMFVLVVVTLVACNVQTGDDNTVYCQSYTESGEISALSVVGVSDDDIDTSTESSSVSSTVFVLEVLFLYALVVAGIRLLTSSKKNAKLEEKTERNSNLAQVYSGDLVKSKLKFNFFCNVALLAVMVAAWLTSRNLVDMLFDPQTLDGLVLYNPIGIGLAALLGEEVYILGVTLELVNTYGYLFSGICPMFILIFVAIDLASYNRKTNLGIFAPVEAAKRSFVLLCLALLSIYGECYFTDGSTFATTMISEYGWDIAYIVPLICLIMFLGNMSFCLSVKKHMSEESKAEQATVVKFSNSRLPSLIMLICTVVSIMVVSPFATEVISSVINEYGYNYVMLSVESTDGYGAFLIGSVLSLYILIGLALITNIVSFINGECMNIANSTSNITYSTIQVGLIMFAWWLSFAYTVLLSIESSIVLLIIVLAIWAGLAVFFRSNAEEQYFGVDKKSMLANGEIVALRSKKNLFGLVGKFLPVVIILTIIISFIMTMSSVLLELNNTTMTESLAGFLEENEDNSTAFVFIILPYAFMIIAIATKDITTFFRSSLMVTDRRIVCKAGSIILEIVELPIGKLKNVTVKQRLLGKIFNYGTIKLYDIDNFEIAVVKYIKKPKKLRDDVLALTGNIMQDR